MLNQIFSIIFMTVAGTAQGFALEYMLQVNDKRCNKAFRLAYWTILALIPSLINVLVPSVIKTIDIRLLLHWVLAIIAMTNFYLDPMWRRFIAIVLVFLGMTSSDFIFLFTFSITGKGISFFADKSNPIAMLFTAIGMIIAILFIFLIAVIWRKFLHRTEKIRYVYIFILYMCNHFITFLIMEKELWIYDLQQIEIIPALTGYLCEMILIILLFSQSEKENMEKSLRITKQKSELEKIHFMEVKKRRDSLINLTMRSDSEIRSIHRLLCDEQYAEAEQRLRLLLQRVEETKEYPYCEISIINVILSEKVKECTVKNIDVNVDIDLPLELSIHSMDLCSIFGNLMDNAIRACEKVGCRGEIPTIDIFAKAKGRYLIIKCNNTSDGMLTAIPEGTGLGLRILKDITNRYEGELYSGLEGSCFCVKIILKVE